MKVTKALLEKLVLEVMEQEQQGSDIVQQIQSLIDKNDFLKGKIVAKQEDLIESSKYVLLLSDSAAQHIKERHSDPKKPGSLFSPQIDLKQVASKLLNTQPSEAAGGRVKWLAVDVGMQIGSMGVAKASPEEVQKMQDYQMPDGKKEMVKVTSGKRSPTNEANLITGELGKLQDGRVVLSLITMFPGGAKIDGVEIPADRSQFAAIGLYFPIESEQNLQESLAYKRMRKLAGILKENNGVNLVLDSIEDVYTDLEYDGYMVKAKMVGSLNGKPFNLNVQIYMSGSETIDDENVFVKKFASALSDALNSGIDNEQCEPAVQQFINKNPNILKNISHLTQQEADNVASSSQYR